MDTIHYWYTVEVLVLLGSAEDVRTSFIDPTACPALPDLEL